MTQSVGYYLSVESAEQPFVCTSQPCRLLLGLWPLYPREHAHQRDDGARAGDALRLGGARLRRSERLGYFGLDNVVLRGEASKA